MFSARIVVFVVVACSLSLFATSVGCFGLWSRGSQEPVDLSREAFIREMVTPKNTKATKRFDDYTPGSYHVNKLDLAEKVSELADSLTKDVLALIVTGPDGPLWAYHVITVIDSSQDRGSVRVNHLVFPHARITNKFTRETDIEKVEDLIEKMLGSPVMREKTDSDTSQSGEYETMALVAQMQPIKLIRLVPRSSIEDSRQEIEVLFKYINELTGDEEGE